MYEKDDWKKFGCRLPEDLIQAIEEEKKVSRMGKGDIVAEALRHYLSWKQEERAREKAPRQKRKAKA